MSANDLVDAATIESKSEAALAVTLARIGIKLAELTERERGLWLGGYVSGYTQGARDAVAEVRKVFP